MLLFPYLPFVMHFAAAFTRPILVPSFSQSVGRASCWRSHRCSVATRSTSLCFHNTFLCVPSAEDMEDVGGLLASLLMETSRPEGAILTLDGDLGAGKTSFARGFIRGATGDWSMRVTSPTFLLSNTYRATRIDSEGNDSNIEYVA